VEFPKECEPPFQGELSRRELGTFPSKSLLTLGVLVIEGHQMVPELLESKVGLLFQVVFQQQLVCGIQTLFEVVEKQPVWDRSA
jgi:hypothetical protein